MELFIARQPIFDRSLKVFGYEILFRSGCSNSYACVDGDQASKTVIDNTFLKMGLHRLTGGKRAFINFTRNLFMNEVGLNLPREQTVIEIMEDLEPDPDLIEVCTRLHQAGYLLALDDFVARRRGLRPLIRLADIIKVDFMANSDGEKASIGRALGSRGPRLLAEKVETREEFNLALDCGYELFQGYFFSKPEMISGRDIPGYKLNHLRMLEQLSRTDLDYKELAGIIRQDLSLSYKLLNYINSAYFGLRKAVSSVAQAIMLLGENEIRKWASLVTLTGLGQDKPQELMITSLARARFCESMAASAGLKGKESELYMMGLLSLLDVLVGRPLSEILEEMPVSPGIKDALAGVGAGRHRSVLDLVLHYEQARWSELSRVMTELGLCPKDVIMAYIDSLERAEEILGIPLSKPTGASG
ncbi:MAG: HDOD domain-containing protein [Syntrophobacteraceae bacterium]|nr:HDOD domain-containing protein [Syntrophobacteraceae bacterium]